MPGEDGDQDRTPHRLVFLVVVGLMVGLGAGTVAAWSLSGDQPSRPAVAGDQGPSTSLPETADAAEEFLSAWERSRREDYIVVSHWHRSTTAGATATETRVFAQRLPDRVRAGAESRSGRIGNAMLTCDRLPVTDEQLDAGDLTAEVECRSQELEPGADGEVDPDAMVAEEVALMRRHVEGTNPLYRVSQQDDCFFLRLARQMVVPPYGFRTTYCFDEASGAVRSLKVERAEGVDTEELTWVTSQVDDADMVAIIEGTFNPASP